MAHNKRGHGSHGYDNYLPNMKPIFLARGPHFRSGGVTVPPITNRDIYPLVAHMLDAPPAPNNGSLDRTRALLAASLYGGTCSVTSSSISVVVLVAVFSHVTFVST